MRSRHCNRNPIVLLVSYLKLTNIVANNLVGGLVNANSVTVTQLSASPQFHMVIYIDFSVLDADFSFKSILNMICMFKKLAKADRFLSDGDLLNRYVFFHRCVKIWMLKRTGLNMGNAR